jgi:hypothetical protein
MNRPYAIINGEEKYLSRKELITYLGTCRVHAMIVDRSSDMVIVELICSGECETIRVAAEQLRELREILPDSFQQLLDRYGI